jgi:hypothetical protein
MRSEVQILSPRPNLPHRSRAASGHARRAGRGALVRRHVRSGRDDNFASYLRLLRCSSASPHGLLRPGRSTHPWSSCTGGTGRGVADVERRTASGEWHDLIDGQVAGSMGEALVPRAPVAVLASPGTEHAGAESLPGPRAVEGVVPATVGLTGVVSTAATRAAGNDTTDRAQLHPRIVDGRCGAVYSPAVLHLRARLCSPISPGRAPRTASTASPRRQSRRSRRRGAGSVHQTSGVGGGRIRVGMAHAGIWRVR